MQYSTNNSSTCGFVCLFLFVSGGGNCVWGVVNDAREHVRAEAVRAPPTRRAAVRVPKPVPLPPYLPPSIRTYVCRHEHLRPSEPRPPRPPFASTFGAALAMSFAFFVIDLHNCARILMVDECLVSVVVGCSDSKGSCLLQNTSYHTVVQ